MKQFLFLLVLLFTTTVYTQQYVQKQESQIINMLSNPGYESGKTSWGTNFTNSLTVVSGTQALFGSASLKFEPQSSVFTEVYSPLLTVPQGLQGQQCNAIVNYRTDEYTNYFVAKVKDASGTELITDVLLPKIIMGVPTEGANSLTLAFECPVSQQIELEISQTISGGYITLDGMHLGSKTGGLGTAEDIIDALGYTPADEVDLNAVSATATTALNTALSVSATVNTLSGTVLYKANNLSDIASATVARTNLGLGTVAVENTVPTTKGGTGQTTYATGDLLVGSGTTLVKLPIGSVGQILKVASGTLSYGSDVGSNLENVWTSAQGTTWSSTANTWIKIPLSTIKSSNQTHSITSNCVTILSAGTKMYKITLIAQVNPANGETANLGYSATSIASGAVQADATFISASGGATDPNRETYTRFYFDNFTFGDSVCAYSQITTNTRTFQQGRMVLEQLNN